LSSGAELSSDLSLFLELRQAPIAAITGTNGKSTVTRLVGDLAAAAGRQVAVGGNLGPPVLELLGQPHSLSVLELSSFQLERVQQLNAQVAALLNFSPDHMDRYADLDSYRRAKQRVFEGCRRVVINRADSASTPPRMALEGTWSFGLDAPLSRGFGLVNRSDGPWIGYGSEVLCKVPEALLRVGPHGLINGLAALAIGRALELPVPAMLAALPAFRGLPHRCQHVRRLAQVDYYDDSKATNLAAAIASIRGLAAGDRRVVWIAGGQAKGADFSSLGREVAGLLRAAVLIGRDAAALARGLAPFEPRVMALDMEQAVVLAKDLAQATDVVLLAPACSSLDMFSNFEERGRAFAEAVEGLD